MYEKYDYPNRGYKGMTVEQIKDDLAALAKDLRNEEILADAVDQAYEAGAITYHHESLSMGRVYCNISVAAPYKGRFGEGYTIRGNNLRKKHYCHIQYYVWA